MTWHTKFAVRDLDKVDPDQDGIYGFSKWKWQAKRAKEEISHRKLTIEEEALLKKLLEAAPYWLVKYGNDAITLLRTKVKFLNHPLIIGAMSLLSMGLNFLKKCWRIK